MEEASAAHTEAAAAMADGEADMATVASVMAAWASTDLVFSGTACFSMHFRSITRRIGGEAVLTIMQMTTSTSGTDRSVNMRPYAHRRISRARWRRLRHSRTSASLRILRTSRPVHSRRLIASSVSAGRQAKLESILHLRAVPYRSQPLPRGGRIILGPNRRVWRAAAIAYNNRQPGSCFGIRFP
jgi:hypothetical protein